MLTTQQISFTILLIAPLLGSILNGLILKPKSPKRSGIIASIAALTSFICALFLFFQYSAHPAHEPIQMEFPFLEVANLKLNWGFSFDALTAVMTLVVTGIGSLIHIYSIGYMSHEKSPSRYFAYLNLFLFNMLILIASDNLVGLFVGWEGVGLCSYLLIGFWFEDLKKAEAGMKAFLVNRIGDAAFLIGVFLCFKVFQSLNFETITSVIGSHTALDKTTLSLIALCFFVGATGKSAQIPLFVWLPDAMAGPTPVSALIHAATMVTAGLYLIARLEPLFISAGDVNTLICIIGTATALLSALIATSQKDIKKILAYSTVSQLGLMFVAMGSKAYFAGIFHLMTHAFFKALLFLGAGSVIHALAGEQDVFNMGGLRKKMPVTFWTCTIATAAICGIPPLSGFFSKDTILYSTLLNEPYGKTFWILCLAVSTLTAFYMARFYALVFLGEYRGKAHPHESPASMTIPLMILAVGSAISGLLGMPHGLHLLPNYLAEFLNPVLPMIEEIPTGISEEAAMAIATLLAMAASITGIWFYLSEKRRTPFVKIFLPFKTVFENKFWIDELYSLLLIKPFEFISMRLANFFDPKIVDGLAVLPSKLFRGSSAVLSLFQVGSVQFYLLVMLIGTVWLFWMTLKGVL